MFKILRENDFPPRNLCTAKSSMIGEGGNKKHFQTCMRSERLATMVLSDEIPFRIYVKEKKKKRRDKPRKSKMPAKSSSYSEGQ